MTLTAILAIPSIVVGIVGAVLAWRKFGPESAKTGAETTQIVVSTTQSAMVIQSGLLDELQEALKDSRATSEKCRAELKAIHSEVNGLRDKLVEAEERAAQYRTERDAARRELDDALGRITHLERLVTEGRTGPAGVAGEQGERGEQGEQGRRGSSGARGSQGGYGEQGFQGVQGVQGMQGEREERDEER